MRLIPFAFLALAACEPATDSTSPETGDAALDQSAAMGTTTQQSVSGTDMAAGDAVGATAPAGTTDQYGNFGAAAGGGDASADTAVGGSAGALGGASTTGMSGTSDAASSSEPTAKDSPPK